MLSFLYLHIFFLFFLDWFFIKSKINLTSLSYISCFGQQDFSLHVLLLTPIPGVSANSCLSAKPLWCINIAYIYTLKDEGHIWCQALICTAEKIQQLEYNRKPQSFLWYLSLCWPWTLLWTISSFFFLLSLYYIY